MFYALIAGILGCRHKHYTFPITTRTDYPGSRRGPYVVCLDCGKEFTYDWSRMKVLTRRSPMEERTTAAETPILARG